MAVEAVVHLTKVPLKAVVEPRVEHEGLAKRVPRLAHVQKGEQRHLGQVL